MPSRKRRQEETESEDEEPEQSTQRRRRAPAEEDSEEDDVEEEIGDEMEVDGNDQDQVVKKLVRYALACEHQRLPIRRPNILEKVMMKQRMPFKKVFEAAQMQLRTVFGMEMVELPAREKVTLKDRRAAQKTKGASKTTASWSLRTILPREYRAPAIIPPAAISSPAEEAAYVGLCTMLVAVIQLNPTHSIPDHKLSRILSRLNAAENMPMDKTVKVLDKMRKEGYIVKTVDKSADEETIDWRVGPRGKVEIGNMGIQGLVTLVYGDNPPEDLQARIHRSLGMEVSRVNEREEEDEAELEREEPNGEPSRRQSRRGRKAAAADD